MSSWILFHRRARPNDLQKYFLNNKGRVINKWEHYFDIYERYFKKGSKKSLILYETKEEFIIVNIKMMLNPILNMFNTDYNETYEIIKEWICKKYNINCIEIIGGKS